MAKIPHHNVYVVELSKAVLKDKAFSEANPHYVAGRPCYYVGMTGLDPDIRFDNHKAGHKANKYAKKYGLRLLPELFEHLNPMSYPQACKREVELAAMLRAKGFAVWQN